MKFSFDISLPPKALAQNDHSHWRNRHRASKEHRMEAQIACRQAMIHFGCFNQPPKPIKVHAHFWCAPVKGDKRYRPLDKGNAIGSLKAAIDGIVDAGVVPSDSHEWLSFGDIELYRTKDKHGGETGLTLVIEADSEGDA